MTQEKWKTITEYQGHTFNGQYEVSSWGNVRNRITGKPLAFYCDKGYFRTKIKDTNDKRIAIKIHRLVAFYFLEPGATGTEIDHIDGNPKNNSISNLRWITHKENMQCMHKAIKAAAEAV